MRDRGSIEGGARDRVDHREPADPVSTILSSAQGSHRQSRQSSLAILLLEVEKDAIAPVDTGQSAGFAGSDLRPRELLEDVGQGP